MRLFGPGKALGSVFARLTTSITRCILWTLHEEGVGFRAVYARALCVRGVCTSSLGYGGRRDLNQDLELRDGLPTHLTQLPISCACYVRTRGLSIEGEKPPLVVVDYNPHLAEGPEGPALSVFFIKLLA